jgi:hypothetical protein
MEQKKLGKILLIIGIIIALPVTILISGLIYYIMSNGTIESINLASSIGFLGNLSFIGGILIAIVGAVFLYKK